MTDAAFAEPRRRGRPPRMRIEDGVLIEDEESVDPTFKADQAPESPLTASHPIETPHGWFDMDDAPQDGKPVVLLGPDQPPNSKHFPYAEAYWRHTRKWDGCGGPGGGIWRVVAFWAVRNSGGAPVPFRPVGWRPA